LGHRVTVAIADNEVIEYEYVHEGQHVLESARDEIIRWARFESAGWMVVRENHRRGVMLERLTQHISRMDLGAVHRSAEELLEGDEAAATIEIEAAEGLVIETPQAQPQKFAYLRRPGYNRGAGPEPARYQYLCLPDDVMGISLSKRQPVADIERGHDGRPVIAGGIAHRAPLHAARSTQ